MGLLGHTVAWVAISGGGTLVLIGVSIKCVEYEIDDNTDSQASSDSITSEQTQRKKKLLDAIDESGLIESEIEDIHISEETILKLQSSMANILKKEEGEGVKLYPSQDNHRVFALDTAPDIIFKMAPNSNRSICQRYQKMIDASTVCQTHKLGLLVIPQAKLFTVEVEGKDYDIIAEQKLDINPNESAQEQYYEDYADSLDETIRQLAIFICKTGYSDVEWRNNPILNNNLDEYGNRKFALIDIEEIGGVEIGLFGGVVNWGRRRGLVRCVNERQGKIVEEVANENGINTKSFTEAHETRKKELQNMDGLKQFYATTEVKQGDEPVEVDVNSIDFSPYQQEAVGALQRLAADVLGIINTKIANSSSEDPIKERRKIHIRTKECKKFGDTDLIYELIEPCKDVKETYKTDEELYNATYMGCVIHKFIQMGLIYEVINRDNGYFIQA